MRKFAYITVGKVLNELNEEIKKTFLKENPDIKEDDVPSISRETFYRLEKRLKLPKGRRTKGNMWRTYTFKQKEIIKKKIKEEYNLPS